MSTQQFNISRIVPLNVLIVEAQFPLVEVAGKRLDTLREDFFDNAVNSTARNKIQFVSAYDIALCGGEPYAVWK